MMRIILRLAALLTASSLLSACLAFGSLDKRGTAIDEGVGTLQNRTILINLARASHSEPLYFVSIGNVTAQASVDLRLSSPQIIEGPGLKHNDTLNELTFNAAGQFLDNTTNTNFQMGVYSTKDFYTGIMEPLTLNDVDLLLHQGFPRELVYYLVIDKAKFTNPDNPTDSFYVYNDPTMTGPLALPGPGYKPTFAAFQYVMQLAMTTGFITEVPAAGDSGGEGKNADQPTTIGAVQAPGGKGGPGAINFVLQPPKNDKAPTARLCFEPAMASRAHTLPVTGLELLQQADAKAKQDGKKPPIYCGSEGNRGNKQIIFLPAPIGRYYNIQIYTRSIYGIFNYLGQMMNRPDTDIPSLKDYNVVGEVTPEGPILTMKTGAAGFGQPCFTAVRHDGQYFCVSSGPEAKSTRQIFNMLNALVALKQSPGDLPASQTVLIAP